MKVLFFITDIAYMYVYNVGMFYLFGRSEPKLLYKSEVLWRFK